MLLTKKLLKITGWLLGSLAVLYLLLLLIAGIYINRQQQRILQYITSQLSERIRGTVTIRAIEVSPWTNFPSIDFRLHEFAIADSAHQRPVVTMRMASTSLSLFQLIRGKTVISNLLLEDGVLHLLTDSTGYSNSVFKKDTSTQTSPAGSATVSIAQVRLKNISITIEDQVKEKEISFVIHSLSARVHENENGQQIDLAEKITMKKGLGFNLARGAFLEDQSINGNWNVQYNVQAKTISFARARVAISKYPFLLDGQFSFDTQNPSFKIAFSAKNISYQFAKQVVTARIRQKLEMVNVLEPLQASGSIEGSLLPAHEPAVNINWQTTNNKIETEAGTFSHCSFSGNFMNSVSPAADHVDSNSRISFNGMRAEWDGIAFTADSASITNLDTARLRLHVKSDCSLQDLDNKLGMEDFAFKSGYASFDLLYDGPIVRDKSMLQDIRGTMTLKNGAIDYTPRGFNFTRCNGSISFLQDSIQMDNFNCRYGDNQFDVALYGSNIRKKFITGDASDPAVLNCFIRSPAINMDDFTSLFGQKKQRSAAKKAAGSFAATARSIDAMLDNSTIGVHVKAATLKRGNLHASNLDAIVRFEPQHWELEKISLNIAGGSIACSGKVLHGANNTHNALFKIKVDNADVSKLLFAFDNFGQEAITNRELSGRFSTVASLQAGVNSLGHIIPASLKGDVDFSLQQGALQNYDPLNRLKSFVFKNRDMRYVKFAELKDKLGIDGEAIFVNRMEIQSSAFRLFLEGNYGLAKRNTDLLIQVPFSNLNAGSFEATDEPVNKGIKAKTGASIWLRAVNDDDGKVKVKLTMKKKMKTAKSGD